MKKVIALMLALVLAASMAACGEKAPAAAEKTPLEGTMEENINKVIEICPVQFMGGSMSLDLTDTSEEGLWALDYNTGLKSAEKLTDAAIYESMIGSQAFSLVMVRVADAANAKAVAQEMTDNINTNKWICVGADQKLVAGYGDTVMLIMLDSNLDLSAQAFVDAFAQVCGGELDFTI